MYAYENRACILHTHLHYNSTDGTNCTVYLQWSDSSCKMFVLLNAASDYYVNQVFKVEHGFSELQHGSEKPRIVKKILEGGGLQAYMEKGQTKLKTGKRRN